MITLSRKSFLTALAATVVAGVSRAKAQQATSGDAIGSVATVKGGCHALRNERQFILKAGNEILRNDVLQTGNDSALGVAFDDETTLALGANTRVTVNNFIYQSGGVGNAGVLTVARGTLTFFAGQVAKTGSSSIPIRMARSAASRCLPMTECNWGFCRKARPASRFGSTPRRHARSASRALPSRRSRSHRSS
jgi:hypothetical protein